MEDGYEINRQYNCVDKASFIAMAEQKAQWEAANTPEAIAKREAEFAAQRDRDRAQRARQAAIEASQPPEVLAPFVLRNVDVNTASEAEIADLPSVGPEVAAKIVDAREQRRFRDWPDLVNRVVGLSAAQPAVYASICGLNVDGKSLEGAPADATMAATIYREHQRRASK